MCRCVYAGAVRRGISPRCAAPGVAPTAGELELAGAPHTRLAAAAWCREECAADADEPTTPTPTPAQDTHVSHHKSEMQQCEASAANGYSMQCDAFCHNPAHSIVAGACRRRDRVGRERRGPRGRRLCDARLAPSRLHRRVQLRSLRAEALRVDVYRHGYYQGLGARLVGAAEIVNHAAMSAQPECEPISLGSVDYGNWAVVARWPVPLNDLRPLLRAPCCRRACRAAGAPTRRAWCDPRHAVAGSTRRCPRRLAAARVRRGGKNRLRNALASRARRLCFVVRARLTADPPEGPTALLVQTSDTTAHAYNGYGGLTTYGSLRTRSSTRRAAALNLSGRPRPAPRAQAVVQHAVGDARPAR